MSNRQIVTHAIARAKNINGAMTVDYLFDLINDPTNPVISRDQIMRAMRDRKNAVKIDKGTWHIKGRATPERSIPSIYPRLFWNSAEKGTYKRA